MSFHFLLLEELCSKIPDQIQKTPFEHQVEAFAALGKCFDLKSEQGRGGLLVLPTGAG